MRGKRRVKFYIISVPAASIPFRGKEATLKVFLSLVKTTPVST